MHDALYDEIRRIAAARDLKGYTEVAPLVGLDMALEKDRAEMSRLLDEISTHEHELGRPLLSAVIVHKERDNYGLPGKGFFTLRKRLKLRPSEDNEAFWQTEVGRVHEAWARSDEVSPRRGAARSSESVRR